MALQIFKTSSGQGIISSDGSFSNPVLFEASSSGGTYETEYWIGSDLGQHEDLSSCQLTITDPTVPGISSWMQIAPDNLGTPGTYSSSYSFSVTHGTYLPIWIKVVVPASPPSVKTSIQITVTYTATSV